MASGKNCHTHKKTWIKESSQEWFDGEITDKIKNCDNLFSKKLKSKLYIDKGIYNAATYNIKKMFLINRGRFVKEY